MTRTLIADAFVLTMDDELGALPRADVLLDGPRIEAVGSDLPRDVDEVIDGRDRIVMPGFVDTHRHMWAAMLRGCACYGDLATYFHDVVFTYGANFTPDDTYTSIRFGLAEAVESGITTMHAWEHNLQTPAHADAALQAMTESGMRGRFSYGPSSDPEAGSSFAQGTETIDFDDVLRVRGERFEHDDGLLHLGIACRGVEYSQPDDLAARVRLRPRARAADHGAHDDDRARRRARAGRSASTASTRRSGPTSSSSTPSTPMTPSAGTWPRRRRRCR